MIIPKEEQGVGHSLGDQHRILVVDDQKLICTYFVNLLIRNGFSAEDCNDAETALEKVRNSAYHLVLCDLRMPGQDGFWLLDQIQKLQSPPMVIIISGQGDIDSAIHCLTHGAHDFLVKPVEAEYLLSKVRSAVERLRLLEDHRRHQQMLEEVAVAERWKAQQFFLSAVEALIRALEAKDQYTEGHSTRVAVITEGIATHANLRSGEINAIVTAARCHDIGKIGMRDSILLKEGRLTNEEYEIVKTHPAEGARILSPIFADMPEVIAAVRHHHERYDGRGYPDKLPAEQIPLFARIIAVADSYDAMTSNRVYRHALNSRAAIREIIQNVGRQFCPEAVKAFLRFYKETISPEDGEIWSDQRETPRFEMNETVLLPDIETEKAKVLDISYSGLRLLIPEAVPNRLIQVVLRDTIRLNYEPKWSSPSADENSPRMSCGGRIHNPPDDFIRLVDQIALPFIERRYCPRINQVLPTRIEFKNKVHLLHILNIGPGGVFILSREPLPVGDPILFSFTLPSDPAYTFNLGGIVSHRLSIRDALSQTGAVPGMGIRFSSLDEDQRERLKTFISSQFTTLPWRGLTEKLSPPTIHE